ncbi:MAG: hypothetical protein WBQ66_17855 [Blastocatellia bacterium]
MCALEPIASTELLKRAIEDVGFVHDRFVESMWAEQSSARLEAFEKELARATETLAVVLEAHGSYANYVALVTAAFDTLVQRLDEFARATDSLVCALEPVASAELLKRTFADVTIAGISRGLQVTAPTDRGEFAGQAALSQPHD